MLSCPLTTVTFTLPFYYFPPASLSSLDFGLHDMIVSHDSMFHQCRRECLLFGSLPQIIHKQAHISLSSLVPKSICRLWQTLGGVLACSLRIKLPHSESHKSPVEGISFRDVIWAVQFSLYLLSILCQFGRGTQCARWRWMSLMSSRYGGFGVGSPQRSACVGRAGGSAGLCSGSQSVPLGRGRPASTCLIHDWVNARVKTHVWLPATHWCAWA